MDILNALANIGFDWRITVANIVNFAIVYFVLKKLVFGPLAEVLSTRKAKIQSGLQNAEDAAALKEKAEEERQLLLREARQNASETGTSAREKESAIIAGSADKAEHKADTILKEANQKAVAEHDKMIESFKSEASNLVVQAAEKLLQDEIVSTQKNQVAANYLKQVKLNNY